MDRNNYKILNFPKYEPGYLADFVGDLRAWVFKYKTEVAKHTHTHHTTIGRYENPDSGIRAPLGYLAYLAMKLVARLAIDTQRVQQLKDGSIQEINRAIRNEYYHDEKPFEDWAELVDIAHEYLEERRLIGLRKVKKPALHQAPPQFFSRIFALDSAQNLFVDFFKWQEADQHARSSWAGMFIWSLRIAGDRFTPGDFLNLTIAILIWITTAWLVSPLLQWPLENLEVRLISAIKFSIASLVIPLSVGYMTQPDSNEFQTETRKQRRIIFLLRMLGAYVGFNAFAVALLFPILIGYYLGFPAFPEWLIVFLVLVPLLFSHIGARRIPADRYLMFGRDPQFHEADIVFLGIFGLFGVFVAGFLYFEYDYISNHLIGIMNLFLLTALSLWAHRKREPDFLSDGALILILGGLLPLSLLLLFTFGSGDIGLANTSIVMLPMYALVFAYIIAPTTLWFTVLLKNKPTFTLRGTLGVVSLMAVIYLILEYNVNLGGWLAMVFIALWSVWGRKRFRNYIWLHPSFGLMIFSIYVSLVLALREIISIWINLGGYLVISFFLVLWAHHPMRQLEDKNE